MLTIFSSSWNDIETNEDEKTEEEEGEEAEEEEDEEYFITITIAFFLFIRRYYCCVRSPPTHRCHCSSLSLLRSLSASKRHPLKHMFSES